MLSSELEPALLDFLLNMIGRQTIPAETFYGLSPVGSSASNGVAERGAQTVEGQIRALKFALLYDRGDILLVWMVEFAGALINRCEVGHDGRTPYGRLRKKSELRRWVILENTS